MTWGMSLNRMRNEWYGDKRDIVKWATLINLAKTEQIETIFQVVLFRPDGVDRSEYLLKHGEKAEQAIPTEVWDHFRDIRDVEKLGKKTGVKIVVHDELFEDRKSYFETVCKVIQRKRKKNWIVFLDPDTGIEPAKPDLKHVKKDELREVYKALQPDDVIVFYQHRFRDKKWIEKTRDKFIEAIDADKKSVMTVSCLELVNDVVFFVAKKS